MWLALDIECFWIICSGCSQTWIFLLRLPRADFGISARFDLSFGPYAHWDLTFSKTSWAKSVGFVQLDSFYCCLSSIILVSLQSLSLPAVIHLPQIYWLVKQRYCPGGCWLFFFLIPLFLKPSSAGQESIDLAWEWHQDQESAAQKVVLHVLASTGNFQTFFRAAIIHTVRPELGVHDIICRIALINIV